MIEQDIVDIKNALLTMQTQISNQQSSMLSELQNIRSGINVLVSHSVTSSQAILKLVEVLENLESVIFTKKIVADKEKEDVTIEI